MFRAQKRILELETTVKQLENEIRALRREWEMEQVHLSDLKEQGRRVLSRIAQRDKREKNGEPAQAEPKPMSPAAAALLRGHHGVLPSG